MAQLSQIGTTGRHALVLRGIPFGDGKTSVRGGFGVFYDVLLAGDNILNAFQPPFFYGCQSYISPPLRMAPAPF